MENISKAAPIPKILVIDDEEIVRESCLRILESQNYQVKTAEDGYKGLDLLKEFHPDLVFVDLKMPGMSGFEVLEEIYSFDATIVTIVITGFATVNSAVEAMKKGTYDFIPKPFKPDELRLITRRALERRKLVLETIALRNEKEMLREHFAAIVSHELKSPLGAVQQNLYVLADDLEDKLTHEQKEKLERLQNRIQELVKLINTWLRVISVDIRNIQEQFKQISLGPLIKHAVETVEPHAVRKDITINVQLPENLGKVEGDEGTLTEAIVNLLTNSVKYSKPGSEVLVSAQLDPYSIEVSVSDKGIGIAEEDINFIFADFYRGKNIPEGERSSGVGLSITKRIIEAHHGIIEVDSKLGEGSIFTIKLPLLDKK
ncbi:MAG: hybrid sensor histidine kinase/response regulator [Anaerolineales bacterium]